MLVLTFKLLLAVLCIGLLYMACLMMDMQSLEGRNDRWVAMLPMNQLGNQLWMLASTHGIARKRGARWCVVSSEAYSKHLTWIVRPEKCPFFISKLPLVNQVITESGITTIWDDDNYARFSNTYLTSPGSLILAHGCMQSYKYFDEKVPVPFHLRATRPAHMFVRNQAFTTAIHIRRGDKLMDYGNVVPPIAYYEQALALLQELRPEEELKLVVLTDDLRWARAQQIFLRASILNSDDVSFDMAIISQCKHRILSIGTFGWWGAYLGDIGHNKTNTIIYPLPQMEGRLAPGFSNEDYFPPHWTSLNYKALPDKWWS
jgi:hypothetical protein